MTDDARFVDWLLDAGRLCTTVEELIAQLADRLPVDRVWIGTKVLHPQAAAWVWIHEEGNTRTLELSYDRFAKLDSVDSPAQRLRLGAPHVRFRADDDPPTRLGDIRDLFARGYTEYYGNSLFFRGEWVGAFMWTTKAPGGFTDAQIALFEAIRPALSAVVEPLARDRVLATLLRTYLGDDAGARVAAGQVRRGDGETLSAAIWFSDVREFTRLSATSDRKEVLDLLNDVFEAMHTELRAHGGQVLKFIGDGMLAVFTDPDERKACESAKAAAIAAQGRLAGMRAARTKQGRPTPHAGIGLHYGEVMYGNVGAPVRLDFTVIGEAVNLAARVEGLCSKLGEPVLVTRAFADRTQGWTDCGSFDLKGVPELVDVYRPA